MFCRLRGKKVILDENLPIPLRHMSPDWDVVTVQYQGWSGVQDGDLIRYAISTSSAGSYIRIQT